MQSFLSVKMPQICDALRDLVAFVQFKKREKHPWRSVNFSKVAYFKKCIACGLKINSERIMFIFLSKSIILFITMVFLLANIVLPLRKLHNVKDLARHFFLFSSLQF